MRYFGQFLCSARSRYQFGPASCGWLVCPSLHVFYFRLKPPSTITTSTSHCWKTQKKKTLLQHTRTEIIVLCAFFFACSFCAQRCSVFGRFSHKNNDETTRLDVLLSSNCCAVRPLLRSYSVESSLGHGNRSCGDACMLYDECQAPARKNVP